MSAPIGPGDYLVCIRTSTDRPDGQQIHAGRIYQAEEVGVGPVGCTLCMTRDWLKLAGDPETNWVWCPCAFRPVYRPKSTFIESLKQPAPEREFEQA